MIATPSPRKRGRPSKGKRIGTFVALPVDLREEAQKVASEEGLPLGDVITRLVAEALGRPAPGYCYPQPDMQEELLPLTKAS